MHNNYFFLKQLIKHLSGKIVNWEIGECFSQNRNELIIGLFNKRSEFYIKADQNPEFSCISFPEEFARARKNSIDLFQDLIGKKILDVRQYHYERAFSLILENDLILVFKLFGNFSNILLFRGEQVVQVFKHNLQDEKKISISMLDRKPDPGKEKFKEYQNNLRKWLPAFDKTIEQYLFNKGYREKGSEERWELVKSVLSVLNDPEYYIYNINDDIRFGLLPREDYIRKFSDPVEAVNFFYNEHQKFFWLKREKTQIEKTLNQQLTKTENYIIKTRKKLNEIRGNENYRQIADILMSNLHQIPTGKKEVTLFDFYNNGNISIKINPKISAQKNAENYYRKSKNQKIEISNLEANIREKEHQLNQYKKQKDELEKISNARDLKNYLKTHSLRQKDRSDKEDSSKFREFEFMGFKILIGKNARNNDELTLHYGYKEDLWLHAKDVTGSHVLVKYQSGKSFPGPVIEKAASLAAYYSRNRNLPNCPVIYTPCKYVRKPKGYPPGAVRVEKEEILFVDPET